MLWIFEFFFFEKRKTSFRFESQCSFILKIEKPFRFMFYVSTSVQKRKSNFISNFVFQFFKKKRKKKQRNGTLGKRIQKYTLTGIIECI